MRNIVKGYQGKWFKWYLVIVVFLFGLFLQSGVYAQPSLSVVGVNKDGTTTTPIAGGYRWLIEEDLTYHVQIDPVTGKPIPDPNTLSVGFHRSYMPVVAKGDETTPPPALNPTKHYFISVVPKATGSYTIGGAPIAPGQQNVTVYVNKLPLPTAQITIFVFEDTAPINNAPDLPEELGLPGFQIILEDAGGRYGISAGVQTQDAFGNPLGAVYQRAANGNFILDGNGNPIVATDKNGNPIVKPLVTGACPGPECGLLTIKNLSPGKYGVSVVPPAGQGWQQTSTIEGTKIIDAWVKANEPPFFAEFGPPGFHVFIGFVKPFADATVLTGGSTISGKVVNTHLSRPPDSAFYNGAAFEHTTPWVGLNDNAGMPGISKGVYATRTVDGSFSIPNVPPGNYQLVVWDDNLDLIFAFQGITVNPGGSCTTLNGSCNLVEVPVFNWFTAQEHFVFSDDGGGNPANANNGFWDSGETGLANQNINIRWRDGTINQAAPTDGTGFVPFDEVFPFFAWQVAEVDFTRFKATGVTVVVDNGGAINPADPWSFGGQLNPQPQSENAGLPYRTEVGPVLTQAFQSFLGQKNVMIWGKNAYAPGENGGIAGIVYYDTTRAEDDPRYNFPEVWSPGIPGVTVKLWNKDKTMLLNETTTDSWDATPPTGCQGEIFMFDPDGPGPLPAVAKDCYDGMRVWNQVRPGIFDGGYAFTTAFAADDGTGNPVVDPITGKPVLVAFGTGGAVEVALPSDEYIVEVVPPTGYEIVKEEDKNVDFGDNYVPSLLALPSLCVGDSHPVPQYLNLFSDQMIEVAGWTPGMTRPLCNRKQVILSDGQNAPADFFFFTEVPIAGHIIGFILDDTANEFDPNSPRFGEKYAPPYLPVSIRDWTGLEIARTLSDQYGVYNALVPSTYTMNRPAPSGVSPNMVTTCMNAKVKADGSLDPFHNPQYSQFCYTFQYMPGATTYLDTPVVPVAAMAGPDQFPLDCEFPDGTPRIFSATVPTNGIGGGPYVPTAGLQIIINAVGTIKVANPAFGGADQNKLIDRDYGFGNSGTVTIGGVALQNVSWGPTQITGTIAAGTTTGQLVVTRGDNNKSSINGVTVTVGLLGSGNNQQAVYSVQPCPATQPSCIQPFIDNAKPGDIILVSPATYQEMLIMWKPLQLQGWGESTIIDAVNVPAERLAAWRSKVQMLVTNNDVDVLPGQEIAFGGIEPVLFFTEEGAGVFVLAKSSGQRRFNASPNARIDGLTITGASTGGGIVANGYARYLEVSNNRIINNNGFYGGGIRLGHPTLDGEYVDAENDNIRIHNNYVGMNGGLGGAGGGVSLCTGSENYQVTQNYICGNFTLGNGGGIGHIGLSNNGLIADNDIIFNESFNQGLTVSGGGIFIGGGAVLPGQTLSEGSGSVKVISNLIQGNLAGAGDGGGIRTSRVNGQEVDQSNNTRNDPTRWYSVNILNNMIVNNISALAGGGISLHDTARSNIIHNTIANNDSTATAGNAFTPGNPNQSNPQPAGIASYAHSAELSNAIGNRAIVQPYKFFSNPQLVDNIIWHNRSFYFFGDPFADPPLYQLLPIVNPDGTGAAFWDLAVLGTATPQFLNPQYCILTDTTGYAGTNFSADPSFILGYFNGGRGLTVRPGEATTALLVPVAFDEGGNFIQVRFGPLTLCDDAAPGDGQPGTCSDYHIQGSSPTINAGTNLNATFPDLALDYDSQPRPSVTNINVDIGADEVQ